MQDKTLKIECVDVPMLSFIEESIQMFTMHAKEKDVKFYFDGFDSQTNTSLPSLLHSAVSDGNERDGESFVRLNDCMHVDVNKMKQVLRNIMSNAFKFTPSGKSVTVRVRKTLEILPPSTIDTDIDNEYPTKVKPKPLRNWFRSIFNRLFRRYKTISVSLPEHDHNDIEHGVVGDQRECIGTDETRSAIGTLIIDVIDSGVGIAAGDQERLFKEIVQFNPSVLQGGGGSGLGMMVSLEIYIPLSLINIIDLSLIM